MADGYAPVPPPGFAPTPEPAPPKRNRAVWWILGVVVLLALLASCTVPFLFVDWGSLDTGLGKLEGNAIAVLYIDGVIAGTGDVYSGYVTPEYFLDQIEQAEADESVKAILLRVDSPGGTVAASEEISTYVAECTKPVVVSVGDIGASGAYMVSSQADEIWAVPGSSVGSIGVISEIPNVSELLDTVGVEFQVITAGKYKDAGSPYRPLTKEETALIQGEVEEAYDQFIDIVAEGRGLERAKVEELATGWVWSGDKAKELGLVDEIGTFRDAADAAADLGGIKGDYETVTYESTSFQDIVSSFFSLASRLGDLEALATRAGVARQAVPR
jgi:protease-4